MEILSQETCGRLNMKKIIALLIVVCFCGGCAGYCENYQHTPGDGFSSSYPKIGHDPDGRP
jgi:hypothetical protein